MKILFTSIGTRGDMEPFLAIAEILQHKGHKITCMFPEQFRPLAEEADMQFESLGTEFIEMLESEIGKFALGGSGTKWQKLWAFVKLARIQTRSSKLMIQRQYEIIKREKPDRIIHNGKVMFPVIWEVDHPGKTMLVSPVPYLHYVKGHTHLAFNSNFGEFFNKLTFRLADWGLVKTIMTSLKWLNIKDIRKGQIKKVLNEHKVVYTISPQLFERPTHWNSNLQVLGYHERHKSINFHPDQDLMDFLERHAKIIFITFGSMTNPQPEEKTKIFTEILEKHQIPAILNTAAGGLAVPGQYNRNLFYFIQEIPYDWIFPKVYGVVHHGGSGTTHQALKYGCASLIVPHIIDQFVWNRLVHEKGAGPKGIKISRISRKNLEPLLLALVQDRKYKQKAKELGIRMRNEMLEDSLYQSIIH